MIKLALDCRFVQIQREGMGRAALDIIRLLKGQYEIHLLTNISAGGVPELEGETSIVWHSAGPRSTKASAVWENITVPGLLRKICPDIYHAPFNVGIPFLKQPGTVYVVTIHDLIPFQFPSSLRWTRRLLWNVGVRESVHYADAICTDSAYSKEQIERISKCAAEKTRIVPLCLAKAFLNNHGSPEATACIRKQLGLFGKYIVYHGGFRAYKNVAKVVAAFESVCTQSGEQYSLCLVGRHGDDFIRNVQRVVERSLYREHIVLPGFLSDVDLAALLGGAACMLFLSCAEGFGFAPLEALACGAPVLCARNTSLPELLGDHVIWVTDDEAPRSIADKIIQIEKDPDSLQRRIAGGRAHAMKYNEARFRDKLMGVYQELLS
ncbi:MAG: glycosyltransferase family 1 protein [Fibrobacterota bacterium]